MQPTKHNHKIWTEEQKKLVEFFNEQSKELPPDWDLPDHVLMILNTAVVQLEAQGVPEAEARHLYDSAVMISYKFNGVRRRFDN